MIKMVRLPKIGGIISRKELKFINDSRITYSHCDSFPSIVFMHVCPNCNRMIEGKEGSSFRTEIEEIGKWLLFCDEECYNEWCKNGKREAMLL